MKICIMGLGNVGLAYAQVLVQNNLNSFFKGDSSPMDLVLYDSNPDITGLLASFGKLPQMASKITSLPEEIEDVDVVLVCVGTVKTSTKELDTHLIKDSLSKMKLKDNTIIVIKSAVWIGFTDELDKLYPGRVFYVPEFLREGSTATSDILNTKKLHIGYTLSYGSEYTPILRELNKLIYTNLEEWVFAKPADMEFLKLARNSYLASRVSFFSEINMIRIEHNIGYDIMKTLSESDPAIGDIYNTPSFGYGGLCLPKDTRAMSDSVWFDTPHLTGTTQSTDAVCEYFSRRIVETYVKNKDLSTRLVFYKTGFKKDSLSIVNSSTVTIMNKVAQMLFDMGMLDKIYYTDDLPNMTDSTLQYLKSKEDILDSDIVVSQFPDEFIREGKFIKITPED